jgi:hypothetical protein
MLIYNVAAAALAANTAKTETIPRMILDVLRWSRGVRIMVSYGLGTVSVMSDPVEVDRVTPTPPP